MVGNAVLSLLSSIVGGVLVLAGQTLARRHEDRRLWLTRLYEAAGDLATSYLQEAARVNDSRRSARVAKDEVETSTYIVDRQKALGRFRTLPWAPRSRPNGGPWVRPSRMSGQRGTARTRSSNAPTTTPELLLSVSPAPSAPCWYVLPALDGVSV